MNDFTKINNALSDVAAMVANYYMELKRLGFEDAEALSLTIHFQKSIFDNANRTNKDE